MQLASGDKDLAAEHEEQAQKLRAAPLSKRKSEAAKRNAVVQVLCEHHENFLMAIEDVATAKAISEVAASNIASSSNEATSQEDARPAISASSAA